MIPQIGFTRGYFSTVLPFTLVTALMFARPLCRSDLSHRDFYFRASDHWVTPPTGEVLREEFLAPQKLTQGDLAEKMGVPIQRINLLINEKRDVTAETAILLAKALGTTPELWMNLQTRWDLWDAQNRLKEARTA